MDSNRSVDIDLTYLDKGDRNESLEKIKNALQVIQIDLQKRGFDVTQSQNMGTLTRLLVSNQEVQIKIETTPVLRETVNPLENYVPL